VTQPKPSPLIQARNFIQAGRLNDARALLVDLVRQNPNNDQAWLLLSHTLSDPQQKIDCLERALRLNPRNADARAQLDNLTEPNPPPALPSVSPFFDEDLETIEPDPPPSDLSIASDEAVLTKAWANDPEPATVPTPESEPASLAPLFQPEPSVPEPKIPEPAPLPPAPTPHTPAVSPRPTRSAKVRASRSKPLPPPNNAQLSQQILIIGASAIIGLFLLFLLIGGYYLYTTNTQKQQATQVAVTRQAAVVYASAVYPTLPPTYTVTPTSTITATPTQTATPTRTPVPTPQAPPATVAAQMDTIQQQVADLRGLAITTDLQRYVIDKRRVDATLEEMFLDTGGTHSDVDDDARVLSALRLINPTFDLFNYTLSGISDGLGGFYTPWSKRLYVIGTKFGGLERFIYSHEYDHALTDSHFNISGMGVYPNCTRTEQQCEAIRGLVEGDATLLMGQWLDQYASPQDVNDIFRQNYSPSNRTLPDQFPPPYASREAAFPYVEGLNFVQSLYDEGNWGAVNQAYQTPPTTTEQVLHPKKYLDGEQARPVDPVSLDGVLGSDWRLLKSDSLGEWMTYLVLSYSADVAAQVDLSTGEQATAGWGGDNYQVYYNDSTQQSILIAHWNWDSQTDADEFKQAMLYYQDKRFRGTRADLGQGDCWEANGQTSCLYWRGTDSLWLLAPDRPTLTAILARYNNFR